MSSESVEPLRVVAEKLVALTDWSAPAIQGALNATAEQLGVGLGKVAQSVRVAATGTGVSPPIDATLELLGRERTTQRLSRALAHARQQS